MSENKMVETEREAAGNNSVNGQGENLIVFQKTFFNRFLSDWHLQVDFSYFCPFVENRKIN
ncbi:MAG: hypothetical protein ACTTKO_06505 [Candidatus Limimorpha sp.]